MKTIQKIILLAVMLALGTFLVLMLFNASEKIVHYNNTFIRRYPLHVAQQTHKYDLRFNSFYFAGCEGNKIYLGNYSTPLVITVIDTTLNLRQTYTIELKQRELPFRTPEIKILNKIFFVYEGAIPYIFKGNTSDWKASIRINSGYHFSQLAPIDSFQLAVRFMKPVTGENVIGIIDLTDTLKSHFNVSLLEKQLDGIFDTDGYLHYDRKLNKVVYLYRYRNQYIVTYPTLDLDFKGNTIDTIAHAKIKIKKVKNSNMTTYSEPPLVVNRLSALDAGRLFVNSTLPGKFEKDKLWKKASIIDVYDLNTKTYQSSFPIYHIGKYRLGSFIVSGNKLFAIIGNHIVCYKLLPHLTGNGPGTNNNR